MHSWILQNDIFVLNTKILQKASTLNKKLQLINRFISTNGRFYLLVHTFLEVIILAQLLPVNMSGSSGIELLLERHEHRCFCQCHVFIRHQPALLATGISASINIAHITAMKALTAYYITSTNRATFPNFLCSMAFSHSVTYHLKD